MKNPLSSNLVHMIETAMDDCFFFGKGNEKNEDGIEIQAEWINSKRSDYSIMQLTILEKGVIRFIFNDYGTECRDS